MWPVLLAVCLGGVQWQHPAGMVTESTIVEMREKLAHQAWAKEQYESRKKQLEPWLRASSEALQRVFPKTCGNVYHNFSCPDDRHKLDFNPLEPDTFTCPSCKKSFPSQTDAGIYRAGDRYKGTMYDGWVCLFCLNGAGAAVDLATMGRVEDNAAYLDRSAELLLLFAGMLEGLKVKDDPDPQMRCLLTYHREGDNKVLFDLTQAYELVRNRMEESARKRVETSVITRMLNDIMLEPTYKYDHNNVYQWHRTIVQAALALEREDLIDWSFGRGDFDPEHQPEHRSMRRILGKHFKPDGAYWELCSGYHLYPVFHLCEFAVLSHHLAQMDPARFPADQYDLTRNDSEGGQVIFNALHWFLSLAMPNRRMPTVGDSMLPEAGLEDYYATAETGYRFFGIKEIGDIATLRGGQRSWFALLYGAPEITQQPTAFQSANLSSGWVSLRGEWAGNRVWAGLNALEAGGGHQHADRLNLLTYSHGQKLLLEKATPYNESAMRDLGTLTPMHNTVTVDEGSQKQGETLSPEERPKVVRCFDSTTLHYAEVDGSHIYPQAKVYRRAVAVIEDLIIDRFEVRGAGTTNWMAHHAGGRPELSVTAAPATFEPKVWLQNGTENTVRAQSSVAWEARWKVGDVNSRLTMGGGADTEIYLLDTYPVANAVITPQDPPCASLCARRHGDSVFLAVWDAWLEHPNLQGVEVGDRDGTLKIRTASDTWYVLFGAGPARFSDGVILDGNAEFMLLRGRQSAAWINGTHMSADTPDGRIEIRADSACNLEVVHSGETVALTCSAPVAFDTKGGENQARATGARAQYSGNLWPSAK